MCFIEKLGNSKINHTNNKIAAPLEKILKKMKPTMQLDVTRLLHSRRDPTVVPAVTYFCHARRLFALTGSFKHDEVKRAHNALFMYGLGPGMGWQAFSVLLGWHGDTKELRMRSKLRRTWEKEIRAHKKGEHLGKVSLLNPDSKLGSERYHPLTKKSCAS